MAKRKRSREAEHKPSSSSLTTTGLNLARPDQAPSIEPDLPAPTDEEWLDYKKYKYVKCEKRSELELTGRSFRGAAGQFRAGEFIYIRGEQPPSASGGVSEDEIFWIGYLKEIRAKDERSVFITVEWMYNTMNQLRLAGVRGLPRRLDTNEIYRSYETDRVSVHVVEERCYVTEFDELNPLQKPIDPNDKWYRKEVRNAQAVHHSSTSEHSQHGTPKKRGKSGVKKQKVQPGLVVVPIRAPTCVCNKPYNPLPLDDMTRMVYCPHASCRKWYHTKCLLERSLYQSASPKLLEKLKSSGLGLLQDFAFTLEHTNGLNDTESPDVADMDARLRVAAQSSIERGGKDTGMVGNGRSVVLARSLLKRWSESSGEDKTLAGDLAQWYAHFGWDFVDPDAVHAGVDEDVKDQEANGQAKAEGQGLMDEETNGVVGGTPMDKKKEWVWTCPSCREAI